MLTSNIHYIPQNLSINIFEKQLHLFFIVRFFNDSIYFLFDLLNKIIFLSNSKNTNLILNK